MNKIRKKTESHPGRGEESTEAILRRAAQAAIGSADIHLEIDVPADARCPVDRERLIALVTAMVHSSVDSLPDGGEISLTLWQTASTCEIEVADTGPAVEMRPRRLPLAAAALDAELVWQNCPQGGAAVTAKLPVQRVRREAA